MNIVQLVGLGLAAVLVSSASVFVIRRWAIRHDLIDIPNQRSSHTEPTPRGGGLAIALTILIGLLAYQLFSRTWPWPIFWAYILGAGMVSAVSWIDDLRTVAVGVRFASHAAGAAFFMLLTGFWISVELPFVGDLSLGYAGLPITFLWIVGLTNAYNFMDGIDGLAAGQASVAGIAWLAIFLFEDTLALAILALLLVGSSLGFLLHNLPPARIFMGDVGSAFLGFSLAAIPVLATASLGNPRLMLLGAGLLAPFIFDSSVTILHRIYRRENLLAAHRTHLYQRLTRLGYTHGAVTRLYIGLALISAVGSIVYYRAGQDVLMMLALLGVVAIHLLLYGSVAALERRREPL